MAVTFTPNLALAKPTESELALEWTRASKLQEDNNIILAAELQVPVTAYTPAFIGLTTNPNLGVGTIVGEYCEFQGIIFGNFNIFFSNPGVGAGSGAGAYGISLPFPVDTSFYTVGTALSDIPGTASCIGEGHIIDSVVTTSGTQAIDVVNLAGVSYARMILETFAGKTAPWFSPGMPMTVDNNDRMTGNFIYKKA